jgi:hypothetical protein
MIKINLEFNTNLDEAPDDTPLYLVVDGKIEQGFRGYDYFLEDSYGFYYGDGDEWSTGYYFTPCEPEGWTYLKNITVQ